MGNCKSMVPKTCTNTPTVQNLFDAVNHGNIYHLREWNEKINLCNVTNLNTGETLLHVAVKYGRIQILEWLLGLGCDCLKADLAKETPLHYAAAQGKNGCLKILIVNGEKALSMTNLWGRTPLMKALIGQKTETADIIIKAKSSFHLDLIDNYGQTPMHIATSNGMLTIIHLLILHSADMNVYDTKGRTALYFATLYHFNDIFDMLITNGCRVTSEFKLAIDLGNFHAVKKFLERGTDLSKYQDLNYMYVLHAGQKINSFIKSKNEMSTERYRIADLIITAYGSRIPLSKLIELKGVYTKYITEHPCLSKLFWKLVLSSCSAADVTDSVYRLLSDLGGQDRCLRHEGSHVVKLHNLCISRIRNYLMFKTNNLMHTCENMELSPVYRDIILMRDL